MKIKTIYTIVTIVALVSGCGKKKNSSSVDGAGEAATSTGGGVSSAATTPPSIAAPVGVLNLALTAMSSAMSTDVSSKMIGSASALVSNNGFTAADCNDNAEAKARADDGAEYTDNSGRLRLNHPRAALQNLYCQMQTDTGSADSFLGSLSQSKMILCLMGDAVVYDNVTKDIGVTKADLLACLPPDATDQDKEDMTAGMGDGVLTAKITASRPAAFGKANNWDGSIEFAVDFSADEKITIKLLLRDSDDVLAAAVLGGGNSTDGYITALNKVTGEIWYEAKFQRIRTPNGTSSSGWNRHARAYIKGTMDANMQFTDVSALQSAFSDISTNVGDSGSSSSTDPIKYGSFWTVKGDDDVGFKSTAYQVSCSGADAASSTCGNVNTVAGWVAHSGSGACNGSLTDTSCTGGIIALDSDEKTAFAMDLNHAAFETTEDWFESLAIPLYTDIELTISQ